MESHFHPAAHDKPFHDLFWLGRQIRTQQRLGPETALGIPDQNPANGHGRQAVVKPDRRVRDNLYLFRPFPVPIGNREFLPDRFRVVRHLLQGRQPIAFLAGPALLPFLSSWGRAIKGGILAKAGDHTNRVREPDHTPQKFEGRKAGIGQCHQPPTRQPVMHQVEHLPRPVGQLLMPSHPFLVIPFRRTQDRQKGQRPDPFGPGNRSQEHQAQPSQPTGFHEMAPAGTYRIPIIALGFDLGAPTAFDGIVQTQEYRTARCEHLDQPGQQQFAHSQGRPLRSVQYPVVVLEMLFGIQTHDPQNGCHGSLSRGEDRSDQQDLSMFPDALGEWACKTRQDCGIFAGQGKGLLSLGRVRRHLTLFFVNVQMDKV
jgi:hypothetical protein